MILSRTGQRAELLCLQKTRGYASGGFSYRGGPPRRFPPAKPVRYVKGDSPGPREHKKISRMVSPTGKAPEARVSRFAFEPKKTGSELEPSSSRGQSSYAPRISSPRQYSSPRPRPEGSSRDTRPTTTSLTRAQRDAPRRAAKREERMHSREGTPSRSALHLDSIQEAQIRADPRHSREYLSKARVETDDSKSGKVMLLPHVLAERLKKRCSEALPQHRQVDQAVNMLKNAPLDAQNAPVWNTLIWECMKVGRYKLAYELFVDMKRRGFSPTTRTFQTMFQGLSRIHDWETHPKQLVHAHSLYDSFTAHLRALKAHDDKSPDLDITPLAAYIDILGAAGGHSKIFEVYRALDPGGKISPNKFILTSMAKAIASRTKVAADSELPVPLQNATDARMTWRNALKAFERTGESVDSYLVAPIIRALAQGGKEHQELAMQITRDHIGLIRPGETPLSRPPPLKAQTLQAALMACNYSQKYELAIDYSKQAIKWPLTKGELTVVDRVHMEEVLKALVALAANGERKRSLEALRTVQWMLRQEFVGTNGPAIRPARSTFNLALLAALSGKDWYTAMETFELMSGYRSRDFLDPASAVERENREPPKITLRSVGRNILPDAESMTTLLQTASDIREHANIRQALRIVEVVGVNALYRLPEFVEQGKSGKKASENANKKVEATYHEAKLSRALHEAAGRVLAVGVPRDAHYMAKAEMARWQELKLESEKIMMLPIKGTAKSVLETGLVEMPAPFKSRNQIRRMLPTYHN